MPVHAAPDAATRPCHEPLGPAGPTPLLRAAVLRAGGFFGWRTAEVIAFAEVLTGCPWPRCGVAELQLVLREYRDLAVAAAVRVAGPAVRLRRRRGRARRN
jgi:hypothetical protein